LDGRLKNGGIPGIKQILIRLALTWSNESGQNLIRMAQFVHIDYRLGQCGVLGTGYLPERAYE